MASLMSSFQSETFDARTIGEAARIGFDFYQREERLSLSIYERERLVRTLVAEWDGVRMDDITRRSLTNDIKRMLDELVDARYVDRIGAVPIAEGKLHPIEDEA